MQPSLRSNRSGSRNARIHAQAVHPCVTWIRGRRLRLSGDPARKKPQREAQHRHDRRRRTGRVEPRVRGFREHRRALRRLRAGRRTGRRGTFPRRRRFDDFRKLYDHANEFDAVVVSTTEHTHAFATLPALQLGKHVYCEKPLTHNVWEARIIREAAAKAKVATQMGTQIHAGDNYRRVVELIQTGAIGPVREAHVWVGRAWGRQSDEDAKKNGDIVSVPRAAGAARRPSPAGSTGTSGSAPRRRGRSTRSTCPARNGIAGGISATAP